MPIPLIIPIAVAGGLAALAAFAAPDESEKTKPVEAGAPRWSSAMVKQRLLDDGWVLTDENSRILSFVHPNEPGRVTIAHPVENIPTGTLRSIFRQAGWKWGEF